MAFKGHRKVSKPDGSTNDSWKTYVCGHCNTKVSGAIVAKYNWEDSATNKYINKWLLCPNCSCPSASLSGELYPGSTFGPNLQGLPNNVEDSYDEARRCMVVNAYTAAELICRKILMHVAADKGAKEGASFASYLSFLETEGYITPPMKGWIDLIRRHGNKSTHKLEAPERERAESTVMFTAELLRLTYEMEYLAEQYSS